MFLRVNKLGTVKFIFLYCKMICRLLADGVDQNSSEVRAIHLTPNELISIGNRTEPSKIKDKDFCTNIPGR